MLIGAYTTGKSNRIKFAENVKDGYIYSGSHNVSKAAWGSLLKSGAIRINNYELGIILPFEWTDDKDAFELPFVYPPPSYEKSDRPWSSGAHFASNNNE